MEPVGRGLRAGIRIRRQRLPQGLRCSPDPSRAISRLTSSAAVTGKPVQFSFRLFQDNFPKAPVNRCGLAAFLQLLTNRPAPGNMENIYYSLGREQPIDAQEQHSLKTLVQFLARVERRALIMAEMATSDREEALDLVQEAMFSFVRHYATKPRDQWMPLFYRVLQNRIRDWYRRSKVRNRWRSWLGFRDEPEKDALQAVADPRGETPESSVDRMETGAAIAAALGELPLRQQQAFMLRNWEGLDVATTARIMGCSQGSVKTHLSRARQNLQKQLKAHRS